jgi:hypothetical protein
MAMNTEEALLMKEAADKNGKLLMIGFVRRHGNDCDVIRENGEIKAVVIPENTSVELKNALSERGISFVEYDGTESDRQAKLTEVATANDSYFSLSFEGETPKKRGNFNFYGKDLMMETPAEDIAPAPATTEENLAVVPDGFAPVPEAEANVMQTENIESVTDADAPMAEGAPYYGESENVTPSDPFESRDIKTVGSPKVKAYVVEHPEVLPYFQEVANAMLGDLQNTVLI